MLDDDLLDHSEAEAGALGFGGEKRPEEFAEDAGGKPGAIVENEEALEAAVVGAFHFAAEDDAAAVWGFGAGFGGVANEVEERLAEQAFVTSDGAKLAFGAKADTRVGFADFVDHTFDGGLELNGFVGDFEGTGVFEEFGNHVGDVLRLLENFGCAVGNFSGDGFRFDHLGVAGNGGQRVLEFVRDAGREFAESGEIVLELNLLLQRGELREVTEQTDGAVDSALALADGRDSEAEMARVAGRRLMRDLLAAEDFA